MVAGGAPVADAPAERHVDLDVFDEAQRDPDREQVAEGDHVLAGVLHRRHDQHAGGPALGEQQLQRRLGAFLQVAVGGVGDQRGQLVDQNHDQRLFDRRFV